jgi:hypothetical protein
MISQEVSTWWIPDQLRKVSSHAMTLRNRRIPAPVPDPVSKYGAGWDPASAGMTPEGIFRLFARLSQIDWFTKLCDRLPIQGMIGSTLGVWPAVAERGSGGGKANEPFAKPFSRT